MELDPATICARTAAGEAELQIARSGLTLPQRKVLSLIVAPQAFADLAAEHHLEPVRLGRDVARLAERGLIGLHIPAARAARFEAAQNVELTRRQGAMLGIGRTGRSPVPAIAVAIAVIAAAVGISWFAWRASVSSQPQSPDHASTRAMEPARAPSVASAKTASTDMKVGLTRN